MFVSRSGRRKKGAALVEAICGLFVFVPVLLFLVDMIAIVVAQSQHDQLAKDCARAAAMERSITAGQQAAQTTAARFGSPIISVNSVSTTYQGNDRVRCETNVTFRFPVQVPFLGVDRRDFVAEAVEPVVGLPPGDTLDP